MNKRSIDRKNYEILGFKKFCSKVLHCMKCFDDHTMQKHYHFFDGSLFAPLMIVGQSPIYPLKSDGSFPFSLIDPENIHQYPSSVWLRKCFTEAGIDFRNVYLTNVVKDSPEGNRVTQDMINNCGHFLDTEIKMFKGNVILVFGKPACSFFKIRYYQIKKREDGKYLVGSYHPQYVLRKGDIEREKFVKLLVEVKKIILKTKKIVRLDDY